MNKNKRFWLQVEKELDRQSEMDKTLEYAVNSSLKASLDYNSSMAYARRTGIVEGTMNGLQKHIKNKRTIERIEEAVEKSYDTGEDKGYELGLEIGAEEGEKTGREKGIAEGIELAKMHALGEAINAMIAEGLDDVSIAEIITSAKKNVANHPKKKKNDMPERKKEVKKLEKMSDEELKAYDRLVLVKIERDPDSAAAETWLESVKNDMMKNVGEIVGTNDDKITRIFIESAITSAAKIGEEDGEISGIKRGVQKGTTKGRKKGIEEGTELGKLQTVAAIANAMQMKGFDDTAIAKITKITNKKTLCYA